VRAVTVVPASVERAEAAVDLVRVALVDPSRARGTKGVLARAHEIRASCGLCGRTSAEGLTRGLAPLVSGAPRVPKAALAGMASALRAAQPRFAKTGGCHAAGLFSPRGELLASAEDVGRHNALDKAIGLAALRKIDLRATVLILSGRGGFELLLKALRVGVGVVASVSASSSLAIAIAEEAGATLVGFVREGKSPRVYTDDDRLV
jgi:FdhD protein